ncbi:MAG: hypothetical protein ABSD98_18705, partial [Candidatus Korobacteraceae bacterium]
LISMTQYLYRNSGWRAIATLLVLWLLVTFSNAQIRDRTQHGDQQPSQPQSSAKKNNKRGPRAIAVLEFLPGGGARLVPVALWIDDRFYDASLYAANPEPMALEPETVYEAYDYGEPTGLFTVTAPEQVKGSWVGTGHWKPELPFDERTAQQAAKQPKPKLSDNPADDRPILHRAGSSGSSNSGPGNASAPLSTSPSSGSGNSSASSTSSNPSTPSDRPTLKKPSDDSSTSSPAGNDNSTASSQPLTPSGPPDRPTLKESSPDTSATSSSAPPAAASTAPASPNTSSPDESDPNRPILRRGKPATTSATTPEPKPFSASQSTTPTTPQPKLIAALNSPGRHSYPAVSDATPHEARSLLYVMSPSERADKSEQMCALAVDEIRKFVATRNTPGLAKNAAITDYDLRAFDLEFSNSPTLVLTATLPVATVKALRGGEFDYFVTLVAHEDIDGTPIKIFSSVTDSNHLDAFARMEIIDAVDADANGRGDLLFRQYSDVGVSYSLYRVYPYDMHKVFEGGSGT